MTRLFARMFDDASLYPPASLELATAVAAHHSHLSAAHAWCVGPFVSGETQLEQVAAAWPGSEPLAISPAMRSGLAAVPGAVQLVAQDERLNLATVEVPLGDASVAEASDALRHVRVAYVEVPVGHVTPALCVELAEAGLRLKLRTGGAMAPAFPTESALAAALVAAVGAGLTLKCTAGLHNAVRHRDPVTGFEHHGFLNVMNAVAVAGRGATPDAVAAILADRNGSGLAVTVSEWGDSEITSVRARFASIGTCSIVEPLADLRALRLVPL